MSENDLQHSSGDGSNLSSSKVASEISSDENMGILQAHSQEKFDPQKLFDLVSKNYDSWLRVINKKFDEDNFLPFPKDDMATEHEPIFNYTLLEALDKVSNDFARNIDIPPANTITKDMNDDILCHDDSKVPVFENKQAKPAISRTKEHLQDKLLFSASEIKFLQDKITQMLVPNNFSQKQVLVARKEGFSLQDTSDEEGLHDGNAYYDDGEEQNDYDVEDINGELICGCPRTRHLEVELNTTPACEEHGFEGFNCSSIEGDHDHLDCGCGELYTYGSDDAASCEFTFEYDHHGKLVPTYSNIEEKQRLMKLELKLSSNARNETRSSKIEELAEKQNKPNKKNKKKKRQEKNLTTNHELTGVKSYGSIINKQHDKCCLFCKYELIYGTKPRQMMKWYDQRVGLEEKKRQELKAKLENAKLKALKKQKELKNRQFQKTKDDTSLHKQGCDSSVIVESEN